MGSSRIELNGIWKLQPGENLPVNFEYEVQVPALVDVSVPVLKWQDYKYFWYKKTIDLPEFQKENKIFLSFEQVKYGTALYVNGKYVGGGIACYTCQEFDVSEFMLPGKSNEILLRVGQKSTLPPENVSGTDFEKLSFIPGIWGDVYLEIHKDARIKWAGIIPDLQMNAIKVKTELETFDSDLQNVSAEFQVLESKSGKIAGEKVLQNLLLQKGELAKILPEIKIKNAKYWSPETPYLYQLKISLFRGNLKFDEQCYNFGMREFTIKEGDFYLNGERRVLKGSNIAFHRMLSDKTRNRLPWQPEWIKKVLIEIPKENNMNFFRFHLGHAYNKWYDIADKYGILLQDEWMFWTSSGTLEQTEKEFTAWVRENYNHPSIIIWDALNESEDEKITHNLIPELKKLDPTRPWEIVDFGEDHPYIYSLGPVLNETKFGFSRSIGDLRDSKTPTVVNEYLWWWTDREGKPTHLTDLVKERWLGRNFSEQELHEQQNFLAAEVTELWRRLDLDAIMPFVYLSVGEGATGNWFWGALKDLKEKPIISVLKNTFSPVGISLELWDRHFLPGEQRDIPVYLFNDTNKERNVKLQLFVEENPKKILFEKMITIPGKKHLKIDARINFPLERMDGWLRGEIAVPAENIYAHSRKKISVMLVPVQKITDKKLFLVDDDSEMSDYLRARGILFETDFANLKNSQQILINGRAAQDVSAEQWNKIGRLVEDGATLILQEPEYDVSGSRTLQLMGDYELDIQYREDPERGGYDSYVHAEDYGHPLWSGIRKSDLQLLNGGFGGEIISQYTVRTNQPFNVLAACNLSLKVPAVLELPCGKGWIVVSRIQVRGRLQQKKTSGNLFDRRYDPVADQYFQNLLNYYSLTAEYRKKVKSQLDEKAVFISKIKASSGQVFDAVDGKMNTRWASKMSDSQWIWIDLGRPTAFSTLTIHWETAFGQEYDILISDDGKEWQKIFTEKDSDGKLDVLELGKQKARYFKIDFKKRGTQWGYSIWEMEIK